MASISGKIGTVSFDEAPLREAIYSLKGENMKDMKLFKVYAVDIAKNKVLIDNRTVISDDIEKVTCDTRDELIRKNEKISSSDIEIDVSTITRWEVEEKNE